LGELIDGIDKDISANYEELKEDINSLNADLDDIENGNYHLVLNGTYTGSTNIVIDTNISAGTYIIDVDNIVSSDTDTSACMVGFYYNGVGVASESIKRGSNIRKKLTLSSDVNGIIIWASSITTYAVKDTVTLTGFKLYKSYPLMDDIIQSRDTRDMVKNLIKNISAYETGERVYRDQWDVLYNGSI